MRDKRFEHRYLTFKLKDAKKYLTRDQQEQLEDLANAVADGRKLEGKDSFEGIFIERDWPEYNGAAFALHTRFAGNQLLIYKGHPNLADMVSTHVDTLIQILENKTVADSDGYIAHEIRALRDIKAAIEAEKSNAV